MATYFLAASVAAFVVMGFLKSALSAPSSPPLPDSSSSEILKALGNMLVCCASSRTSLGSGRSFVASSFVAQLQWKIDLTHRTIGAAYCNNDVTHLIIWPGIETLALSTFRTCPLRMHHSMAFGILWKYFGRERKKLCMLAKASMAVPSTTSMTVMPIRLGASAIWAKWTAIAPPIECPTTYICGASSG